MSLRNPEHPGELRTALHTTYERYAQGLDMFPKLRLAVPVSALPRKTQQIGGLLERAWQRIDEDDSYFNRASRMMASKAHEKVAAREFDGSLLAITLVGRHCVKMASITPTPTGPEAIVGVFPRAEFVEQFEGFEFGFNDGRTLTLTDGIMVGDFDAAIARRSNVSGIMMPRPETPVEAV